MLKLLYTTNSGTGSVWQGQIINKAQMSRPARIKKRERALFLYRSLIPTRWAPTEKRGWTKKRVKQMVIRVWLVVRRWLLCSTTEPNECAILELSGVGVSSGNSYTHQRGERQKPHGGVPSRETKATTDKMKGFQHKLGFTQGIIVPSDGKSGGLALL